jgi:quercetin dioxygenase-like cupin family protein
MMTKKLIGSLLAIAALCAVVTVSAPRANAQGASAAVVWPAGDIKWVDNPAIKGAKIAVLWGDPKTGAYGALKSLPDGATLALHTHTYEQKVLTTMGTIMLAIDGAAAKPLGVGSYALIPGGTKHTANCKAGSACQYLEIQPGASDVKFVTPAKP